MPPAPPSRQPKGESHDVPPLSLGGELALIAAVGSPEQCYRIEPLWLYVGPAGRLDLRQFAAPLALVDPPSRPGADPSHGPTGR